MNFDAYIQEMGHTRTSFGLALYIKVRRYDGGPMYWAEIWQTFAEMHPGKWAVQFFPPESRVIDEANIYHLYVLDEPPSGVDINK